MAYDLFHRNLGAGRNGLAQYFEYIARDLQAPQSAVSQLERLEKRIYSLDQMPNRHHLYGKEPWRTRGLRVMVVDNYCVFYLPDTENMTVNIHRVLYGRRNLSGMFG